MGAEVAQAEAPAAEASRDWVMFGATSGLGAWHRRSAAAQTLLLGAGFAVLLLMAIDRALARGYAESLGPAVRGILVVAAVAAFVPLAALALLHARWRLDKVEVDPAGLVLHPHRAPPLQLSFRDLEVVRPVAEPAFRGRGGPRRHGALAELPGFHAALHVRARDGRRWHFAAARVEDVEGVMAWMGVLGVGDKVAHAPSALAAERSASASMALATRWLVAAIGACAVAVVLQAAERVSRGAVPAVLVLSLAAIALGCLLYLGSFRAQGIAARAWLESRGLAAGPPPRALAELAGPDAGAALDAR